MQSNIDLHVLNLIKYNYKERHFQKLNLTKSTKFLLVSLNFPILNTLKRFVLIVLMSLILFSCKKNNKEDLSDTTKTKVNTNKIVGWSDPLLIGLFV